MATGTRTRANYYVSLLIYFHGANTSVSDATQEIAFVHAITGDGKLLPRTDRAKPNRHYIIIYSQYAEVRLKRLNSPRLVVVHGRVANTRRCS